MVVFSSLLHGMVMVSSIPANSYDWDFYGGADRQELSLLLPTCAHIYGPPVRHPPTPLPTTLYYKWLLQAVWGSLNLTESVDSPRNLAPLLLRHLRLAQAGSRPAQLRLGVALASSLCLSHRGSGPKVLNPLEMFMGDAEVRSRRRHRSGTSNRLI